MAALEQRESGYWQVKVRRKGWPSQSKTFRTKTEAEMWARQIESEMDRGAFVSRAAAERTTVEHLAKTFREGYAPKHYRGAAWKHKLDRLVERLGKYSLAALTPEVIGRYRDHRLKDPDPRFKKDPMTAPRVSGSTVKTELDLLSKLLNVAEKEFGIHLANGNPVRSIQKPASGKGRERRLSADQWTALEVSCKASRNQWLLPALLLAVETAMRQGELLGMRWERLDTAQRFVLLPHTKNGEARAAPLSSRAVAILEGLPRHISGRVVPLEKQTLYSAFKAAVSRAKIKDFTWHDLRHEALSRLAERGDLSVLELAAVSGHKTLQMLKRYTHLQAAKLAQKLG
ncbi:MAG: site-specific integrase [Polaromonas sp.]